VKSPRRRASGVGAAIACIALASSFAACDAIIGIEELSVAPPPENNGLACTTPADCPAASNPCFLRACTSAGICELRDVEPGYVVEMQVPGDCITVVCEAGVATDTFDAVDFTEDGNPCTQETCVEGVGLQTGPAAAGTDCGGLVCDGAGNCVECNGVGDCTGTQICQNNTCVAATCNDDMENGLESDVDCGGDCLPCGNGLGCFIDADCKSGVCDGTCQVPDCNDNTLNGNETDVDCGGSCDGCELGQLCEDAGDCAPDLNFCVCDATTCTCEQPSCTDDIENGTELAPDCGPDCVNESDCTTGDPCESDDWCQSGVCDIANQKCLAPTCNDGVANGNEGGVDCDCPILPIPGCPDCTEGCG
jgi:hypothetical protein